MANKILSKAIVGGIAGAIGISIVMALVGQGFAFVAFFASPPPYVLGATNAILGTNFLNTSILGFAVGVIAALASDYDELF